MLSLIKKYPLAALISGGLHVVLAVWLSLKLTSAPSPVGQDLSDAITVKGVMVSEEDVQAEIDRLQEQKRLEEEAQALEQREREQTLADIEQARAEAEQKLQETEKLTELQQRQVEQERQQLDDLRQQALDLDEERKLQAMRAEAENAKRQALAEQMLSLIHI